MAALSTLNHWLMFRLKTTIIVISVGKAPFFTSFFLPSPAPGPVLSKTLMFVRVIVLSYPNIKMDYCYVVQPSQLLLSGIEGYTHEYMKGRIDRQQSVLFRGNELGIFSRWTVINVRNVTPSKFVGEVFTFYNFLTN